MSETITYFSLSSKCRKSKSTDADIEKIAVSALDDRDPILTKLQSKNRPIIWSIGIPTRTMLDIRKKYTRTIAASLGFKYINLDEQILKWIEEYKENIAQSIENPQFKISHRKVRTDVTQGMNFVVFQLKGCSISLKIVPTRSASKSMQKKMVCNDGNAIEATETYLLQPFHITEQLTRKKALDLLKFAMYDNLPASGFLIDGFPKDKTDAQFFERTIYRAASAIYWAHSEFTENVKDAHNLGSIRKTIRVEKQIRRKIVPQYLSKTNSSAMKNVLTANKRLNTAIQKSREPRQTRSSPGHNKVLLKVSNGLENEKRVCTVATTKCPNKPSKKVTFADFEEHEKCSTIRNFENSYPDQDAWNGSYGEEFNNCRKKMRDLFVSKFSPPSLKQQSKQNVKPAVEFPKYAIRAGQYTNEDNEKIVSLYGNKAIKLEDADLLKLHPNITNILTTILVDLLIGILRKSKCKFGKRRRFFESFSDHTINFSVAEFRFKPIYPGPTSGHDFFSGILSKVQRVIQPLLVDHEKISEPATISIQSLIDAINEENWENRKKVFKQKLTKYNHFEDENANCQVGEPETLPTEKVIIRGRRLLSRQSEFPNCSVENYAINRENCKIFEFQCKQLSPDTDPVREIIIEESLSDLTTEKGSKRNLSLQNKSFLELENLEEDISDVFLYDSVMEIKDKEQNLCTSSDNNNNVIPFEVAPSYNIQTSNQFNLKTTENTKLKIKTNKLLESSKKSSQENISSEYDTRRKSSLEKAIKQKKLESECESTNMSTFKKLIPPKELSFHTHPLIYDTVFRSSVPTKCNNNVNDITVEVVTIENITDTKKMEAKVQIVEKSISSSSGSNITDESNISYGDSNANVNTPTFVSRKRLCKNSNLKDKDRLYEKRCHNWAVPYFNSSFSENQKNCFRRTTTRFWNAQELDQHAEQEYLNPKKTISEDLRYSFVDDAYPDSWRRDWIEAFGTREANQNVSFLKRMCDCLCFCLAKYNEN